MKKSIRIKIGATLKGEKNGRWKGGISQDKDYLNKRLREWRHRKGISKKYSHKYGGQHLGPSPWAITHERIKTRCVYDKNSSYYKRGIKCQITTKELKILWLRDNASMMKSPSIDRIDNTRNYTFKNCRYIELKKNKEQKKCRNHKHTKYSKA